MNIYEQLNHSLRRLEKDPSQLPDILSSKRQQSCGPLFEQYLKGILENKEFLDALLDMVSKLSLKKYRRIEYYYLLIGAYGVLFLNKPDYAVVNSIVELVKRVSPHRSAAFNAILRRLGREKASLMKELFKGKSVHERLSIQYSVHPELVEILLEQFSPYEVEEYFRYALKNPPLDLCIIDENIEAYQKRLRDMGMISRPISGTSAGLRLESTDVPIVKLPGFSEGKVYIMGASAQLVCEMVPALGNMLDLCAAPGGKSICTKNRLPDIVLTSCDVNEARIRTMRANFRRTHTKAKILQQDATEDVPEFHSAFDVVLLDAPCTSSGLLQRHPDLRRTITRQRVQDSARIQQKLLERSANYVKSEGFLIYCTCSILKQEGLMQIESFLRANKEFSLVQPDNISKINPKGHFQTWPWKDDCDGFFGALLKKERG